MPVIFITGIDTGVGKTIITGLMAKYLMNQGKQVITAKIAQTGNNIVSEDIELHREIMGIPLQDCDVQGQSCPYIFPYPASPHLSARLDNKKIDIQYIDKCIHKLTGIYQNVLLEGVGGLMVPLHDTFTTFDYLRERKYPVVVVTTPRLGSINHTLLTLHSLKNAGIPTKGLVYNHAIKEKDEITRDTIQVFKRFYPGLPLIEMPLMEEGIYTEVDFKDIFQC